MKYALLAIVLFFQSGPPKSTDPLWNTVWTFKVNNVFDPSCRIYVSVNAPTEGAAVIRAHKYITDKLSIPAAESLEFVEAQQRTAEK